MALPTALPEQHGLASQSLLSFVDAIEQHQLDVNSFMLLQHGSVTAQFWRKPYERDCPQLLFSLSKSVTSLAVGIAWDERLLRLDDPIVSFFPDERPAVVSPHTASMTVHHLLAMNAGHDGNIYEAVIPSSNWVRAFLALDVEHPPGSHYRYSTPCSYMLSAIVERAAGESLVDYLMPRLFAPLGIPRPSWETCPQGVAAGGMGLSLTTESVAKLGLLLVGKGMYGGQRIVSERYIQLATSEQSDNRAGAVKADSAQGYGYQFILARRGCYRGGGAFGQLCFVAPNEQVVIAATCSFSSSMQEQQFLDLIYTHLLDRLDANVSFRQQQYDELQLRLSRLSCPLPAVRPVYDPHPLGMYTCYRISNNPHRLQQMTFRLHGNQLELDLRYGDERDHSVRFDLTRQLHTDDLFHKDLALHRQRAVTCAVWQDRQTLQLTVYYIETPYKVTYTVAFQDTSIHVRFQRNVSLHLAPFEAVGTCTDALA